jgi:antitoxin component YwqK of YwqJK toxin-antitoxin module
MRVILFIVVLLGGFQMLPGQNQLDDQGRKTGHWKVDHPSGKTLYEADFKEGLPVGTMIRYYESGIVRARMRFDSTGIRNYTWMFYPNGKPAAEGWFVNQQKDSVWTYFSPVDGTVRIREPYQNGHLHGIVRNYYPSGRVSEELTWEHNVKQGLWKQFYTTGTPRLTGHYRDDRLNGSYEVYFGDGGLKIRGEYLDNQTHGTWTYFDESGTELISVEFLRGIPVNQEQYYQWINDTLEKYQQPISPEAFPEF